MTTEVLTVLAGYKGNTFFLNDKGDILVVSGYDQGKLTGLTQKKYDHITTALKRMPVMADPLVEIGRTFEDLESARSYALALSSLEQLRNLDYIISKNLYPRNGHSFKDKADKLISAMKSNGFDKILADIPTVREQKILEKLGFEKFKETLELLVSRC